MFGASSLHVFAGEQGHIERWQGWMQQRKAKSHINIDILLTAEIRIPEFDHVPNERFLAVFLRSWLFAII